LIFTILKQDEESIKEINFNIYIEFLKVIAIIVINSDAKINNRRNKWSL